MKPLLPELVHVFEQQFSSKPRLFRSPGRINIIGEHTDYNQGFVLPAAIDKEMVFAVAPNGLKRFRFIAYDLNESIELPSEKVYIQSDKKWSNYMLGVVDQLHKRGISLPGTDVVVGSTIPIGAGVSSSAAMECGFLFALNSLYQLGFETLDMVKMAQKAEHAFAGVQCGIMDQFAVMFGKAEHVIELDCRSLDFHYRPFKLQDYSILLCDTGVKHSLASSEYNVRRRECEEGVAVVAKRHKGISSLRDISFEQLRSCADSLSAEVFNRCSYVIEENERLQKSCLALENKDIKTAGKLMFGSHDGLKNQYAVSCTELDKLVDLACGTEGVVGARMMGGGFGGCTLNIVHNDAVQRFEERIRKSYYEALGLPENIIKVVISNGTSEI